MPSVFPGQPSKHSETLDENFKESHLRDLPFEQGVKSLWGLVVCYRERKLADLKYQKKKLNLCKWHIPESLESRFAGLLRCYRSYAPLLTKLSIKTCDFTHIKCSYCKSLSQRISCDEKNCSDAAGQVKFRPRVFETCLLQ